ncbi:MAG TPA: hypothetical protein VF173_02830 [Thermoanaerobaculia bacterium]|nr:hypothetical protein [Thermoanaerobaculia bacterium]
MPPSEAARILELLDSLISLKRFRFAEVERRLGMSAGTLRRILNGRIELKFRHITDILGLLDMPPRTFFKIAYETDDLAEAQNELARAHRVSQVEPKPAAFTPSELEAVVVATIERLGLNLHPADAPARPKTKAAASRPQKKKPKPAKKPGPQDRKK